MSNETNFLCVPRPPPPPAPSVDPPMFQQMCSDLLVCVDYFVEAMFCLAMDSAVLLSPILQLNSSDAAYRLQFDYRLSHPKLGLRVLTKTSEADDWRPTDQNLTFEMQKNSSGWSPACFDLRGPIQRIAFIAEKIGFTQNLESAAIASVNITKDVRCQGQGDSKARSTFVRLVD